MRIRDIVLVEGIKPGLCGWPGCRKALLAAIAYYEVRTGRTQAGLWATRKTQLCVIHHAEFITSYMAKLCPQCKRDPLNEGDTLCERCTAPKA